MPLVIHRRGCGYRLRGAVYFESHVPHELDPAVDPEVAFPDVDQYVLEPPVAIDPERMGLSAIGVKTFVRDGVTHILDWIGESHYPTPAQFLAEARRLGVSRRLPTSFPFASLTNESRLLCVHRNAGGLNRPAIFASFPLTQVVVIRDPVAERHVATAGRIQAQNPQVPVAVVDA